MLALQSVSGNTHAVWSLFCKHRSGCSYWDASGEFCLPSSRSPLLLRVSTKKKKKKKSVWPHDSPFIQARVRQPFQVPPDSAFDRSKMNSSRPSARYHTEPLKVMAQASRLAGPDDAVPSLPGSDSWLSKRNKKKFRSLFLHVLVQSSYILLVDVVWTFWIWSSTNMHRSLLYWARHAPLTLCMLCDCVTCVRSTHDHCTRQASASGMTCDSDVMEKPSRRWRGAVQQLADFVWES